MTYTTRIKEEIAKNDINDSEKICELSGFIRFAAVIKDNISITLENASITRRIYKHIKEIFNIQPRIIIRNQKRFRIKQIYILEINEKVEYILNFLNVTENMTLPILLDSKKVDESYLKELIETLGLQNRVNHLPNELSGGQQQRVSIGRALMNHPALLLADEPTGNLDSKASKEIVELLKLSNKKYKQTIIMITHDYNLALNANRIITIDDGKIISDEKVQ